MLCCCHLTRIFHTVWRPLITFFIFLWSSLLEFIRNTIDLNYQCLQVKQFMMTFSLWYRGFIIPWLKKKLQSENSFLWGNKNSIIAQKNINIFNIFEFKISTTSPKILICIRHWSQSHVKTQICENNISHKSKSIFRIAPRVTKIICSLYLKV